MSEEKKVISNEALENVNGGAGSGAPCVYTYVCFNGIWGWANSAFLY